MKDFITLDKDEVVIWGDRRHVDDWVENYYAIGKEKQLSECRIKEFGLYLEIFLALKSHR